MRRLLILLVLAVLFALVVVPVGASSPADPFDGLWVTALDVGDDEIVQARMQVGSDDHFDVHADPAPTSQTATEVEFYACGFIGPFGMDFDAAGNLYVANEGDGGGGESVSKVTPAGEVSFFATGLFGPAGLEFDASGLLHVSDDTDTVFRVSTTGALTPFITGAGLGNPNAIGFDANDGGLYVAHGGIVEKFDTSGASVLTSDGSFNTNQSIAVDDANNLVYTSDFLGNLYTVDQSTGATTMVLANVGFTEGGLAMDANGFLYYSAYDAGEVLKIDPSDWSISTFVNGLETPRGLRFDAAGDLYITSYTQGRIFKSGPTGGTAPTPAFIQASLTSNWVGGNGWLGDLTVTIDVGGTAFPGVGVDGEGNFFDDTGLDLVVGDLITVTGNDTGQTKEVTLVPLTFDVLDANADVASGTADPGARVIVGVGNEFDGASLTAITESSGAWVANFATIGFDITADMGGDAGIQDLDCDVTFTDSPLPPIGPIEVDEGDVLMSQTDGVLWVYDPDTGDLVGHPLPFGGTWDIQWASSQSIYMVNAFDGRVWHLDLPSGELELVAEGDPLRFPIGLASDPTDEHALWVADSQTGILRIDLLTQQVEVVVSPFNEGWAADGIAVDLYGSVLFTDLSPNLYRVAPGMPGGYEVVAQVEGYGLNGLVFEGDGNLLATSMSPSAVIEIDVADGTFIVHDFTTEMRSSEDTAVTSDGGWWVIDSGFVNQFGDDAGLYLSVDRGESLQEKLRGEPLGDTVDVLVVPSQAFEVAIDIKPGGYPNSLNIDGKGVIPVAVLGTDSFDVVQIDVLTLDFAGLEAKANQKGEVQCAIEDVSGDFTYAEGAPDGYQDLVCHFLDDLERWNPDNGTAILTGSLLSEYGGTVFAGSDEYRLVPVGQVGSPGKPVKLILPPRS